MIQYIEKTYESIIYGSNKFLIIRFKLLQPRPIRTIRMKRNVSLFFLRESCCVLIFLCEAYSIWNFWFVRIVACGLFKKLNVRWFMSSRNLLYFCFSSLNLLHNDLYLRETCTLIFSLWNRFCSWNLLHGNFLFVKFAVCWFFSLHEAYCVLIFFFVKHVASGFFESGCSLINK